MFDRSISHALAVDGGRELPREAGRHLGVLAPTLANTMSYEPRQGFILRGLRRRHANASPSVLVTMMIAVTIIVA